MDAYDYESIESRWRDRWMRDESAGTPVPVEGQQTFYCLDFFPYPSGAGLSVGHGRNYVPSDVISRYHRMRGDAVLHPMGWDAFGLPAENEAIARGTHPAVSTGIYAANYRRQLTLLGCSYDWAREFSSSDPAYYRWTQAMFLRFYRRGLAYRAEAPVNWCESCQTVLADEEIEAGLCWRCHQPVSRRPQRQWFLRVTAYAEELLSMLEQLDWPEPVIAAQRHWIGRSAGTEIALTVADPRQPELTESLTIFTTRPDTFFGVSFVALAPEHPLAFRLVAPAERAAAGNQIRAFMGRSSLERRTAEPEGAFTGAEAILPDGRRVPIYVADYVLAEHGTGAIMGVPAHDARDFAFARRYALPMPVVIAPPAWNGEPPVEAYAGVGMLVNSGVFTGMDSETAKGAVSQWLTEQGWGQEAVHYRLRDWLISRQRYWGTPIPIVHCPHCGEVPVPEDQLPVLLPSLPDYRPRGDGRAPLANVPEFVQTSCPVCGGPAERETDTMTGFVCSSWYYLRFASPHDATQPFDPAAVARWLPVNLYVGGAEHALGHLMYARFWTKVLADEGLLNFREPFPVLRSQGVLHVRDPRTGRVERMSKSKGNVVTPDSVIARYGADATRLYLLFMGPFEAPVTWEFESDPTVPHHIEGVRRFLQRVWRIGQASDPVGEGPSLVSPVQNLIQAVTQEIEAFHFNKALSALMTFVGELEDYRERYGISESWREGRQTLILLLAPLAPYITEEIWERLGYAGSVHRQPWPVWNPDLIQSTAREIPVQVDGRVRDRITVTDAMSEAALESMALAAAGVRKFLKDRAPVQVIVVPGRLVNIVTR